MTTLPAFLQNYRRGAQTAALDSLAKMATGAQPYISIQGNRFRAIDAVGEEQMIGDIDRKTGVAFCNVVIVHTNMNTSKVYYAKEFDPKAQDFLPPDCWSDNGIAPSVQAQSPQSPTCAGCPRNVWGSATSRLTGKQTKACNDSKKIAVFVPEMPGMGAFLLRVPPASLKELADYARKLAANGAGVAQIITRISFAPEGVGMLQFTPVNWIDENIAAAIDDLPDDKLDLLVGAKDQPRTAALPGAGDSQAAALAKQKAEYEAAQPAPVDDVKKGRTRRTKAEMEAARAAEAKTPEQDMFSGAGGAAAGTPAPINPPTEDFEVPAFLNGGKPGAKTNGGGQNAGMQTPATPSGDLQAALDAAFALNAGA